jgi:hypothetical protein
VGGVNSSTITTVASNVNSATSVNTPNTIVKRDNNGDFSTGTITGTLSGTASGLTTARTISTTGDVTSTGSFNGTSNLTLETTLANSGVSSGTYGTSTSVPTITVDSKGRITSATNTNIPSATSSVTGLLTSSDYATFSGKQPALTLGTGIESFLASPTSTNLATAVTNDVGTGSLVFSSAPTLTNATLSGTLTLTAPLTVANGGTGTSTYTKGDILYASATNTLSKLPIGTEGQVLVTSSTGNPSWGSNGLYSLNGLTALTHTIATTSVATSNFSITSVLSGTTTATHTIGIPDASTTSRGLVSIVDQSFKGIKTFDSDIISNGTYIGRGNSTGTGSPGLTSNLSIGIGNKNFSTSTGGTAAQGVYNIAIGKDVLKSLTTGNNNNALGQNALFSNTTGSSNSAFGFQALNANTIGNYNTAIGESALSATNHSSVDSYKASKNTAVGWSSLSANTTGYENTAIGSESGVTANNLYNTTAIGYYAKVGTNNTIQLGNTDVTSVVTSGTLSATGAVLTNLRVTGGTLGSGKVLTSDGSGNATWQSASAGISGVGTITTTAYSAGATVSGNNLVLAAGSSTSPGILTTGIQTIAGNKTFSGTLSTTSVNATSLVLSGNLTGTSASFSSAVTGAPPSGSTTLNIDFTSSNLAFSTLNQANPIFILSGLKNGGTYTLAWQGTTARGGSTSSFSSTGFTFKSLGNYPVVSGKDAIYTFVVMGTTVYYSMISEQ